MPELSSIFDENGLQLVQAGFIPAGKRDRTVYREPAPRVVFSVTSKDSPTLPPPAPSLDPRATEPGPVVLFDGVCNLCAWAVQFIIERDPEGAIRFAPLQSATAQHLMATHGLEPGSLDSFVLVEAGQAYTQSTAALKVARHLSGLWPMCHICIILPHFVRDPIYRWIARNRYRWFGKKDSCMLPTPALRARFLDKA